MSKVKTPLIVSAVTCVAVFVGMAAYKAGAEQKNALLTESAAQVSGFAPQEQAAPPPRKSRSEVYKEKVITEANEALPHIKSLIQQRDYSQACGIVLVQSSSLVGVQVYDHEINKIRADLHNLDVCFGLL